MVEVKHKKQQSVLGWGKTGSGEWACGLGGQMPGFRVKLWGMGWWGRSQRPEVLLMYRFTGGFFVFVFPPNFKLCILYWGIADEQCCDSFRWTVKGLSHTCTCICSSPNPSPTQAGTEAWVQLHVLHNRFLLVIHFEYSNVCVSFPNSLTISLAVNNHKFVS